jgi:phage N-6-adenine-methyltransferase
VRISTGPESKQDYSTPDEFVRAVERRWGPISFDLAADADNSKAPKNVAGTGKKNWFDEQDDSLVQEWHKLPGGLLWLNPPFRRIEPWAKKCAQESVLSRDHIILLLVPAAVGANWYAKWCYPFARTVALTGRICFIPGQPFPKDCMLCVYGPPEVEDNQFEVWDWRKA